MPRFRYRAIRADGRLVEGMHEAADRDAVLANLRRQGLRPLAVHAGGVSVLARLRSLFAAPSSADGGQGLSEDDRVLLVRELAALLGAGLPLTESLQAIARQREAPGAAACARVLRDQVARGVTLSQAIGRLGARAFPPFVRGMVRSGEAGGRLAEVLADLADQLEEQRRLRREIRSALTYPTLVLVTAAGAIAILLFAVIPEFAPLFADAGDTLPASARFVLWLSDFLRRWWWSLPLVGGGLWVGLVAWVRVPDNRARLDALVLRVPRFGSLLHRLEAVRFARTLGSLLESGVDLLPALQMAGEALRNRALARRLEESLPAVRRGEGLARALRGQEFFPPIAQQMLEAGERSGALARMLKHAAAMMEDDTRREIQGLLSLLVPVVTLLLGIIVALIVGSVMSAILASYDLAL